MPKHRPARVALGVAVLVSAAGVLFPTASARQSISLASSSLSRSSAPTAFALAIAATERRSPSATRTARPTPTLRPAPAPTPTPAPPPPPPPPPAPPTAGGLDILVDPVVFKDDTARHPGAAALGMMAWTGILVDADSRTILWDNHSHLPMPPASTTKIVTSLVALNNFPPDKQVTITPDALTQADDETKMGLSPGETLSVEGLLSGMLTVSANDAATAMAVDTVGMGNFVAAMNAQMQALGLHDSHFTTPVGLDDPQQYASAYDLAAVGMEDMARYPVFGNIVGRTQVNLAQTATHKAYELPNLNRELQFYPAAIGIKPGYTGNAGPCLVAEAVRGGHHLIGVVLQDNFLYSDMAKLFDWGFAQYGLPPLG